MFHGTNITHSSGVDQDTYGKQTSHMLKFLMRIVLAVFMFYTPSQFLS